MADHHAQIEPAGDQHVHQAAHALFAAGAQGGVDAVVAETGGKGRQRDRQIAGVNAQAGQRAAGLEHPQRRLEGGLRAQCLDRRICTAATGQLHHLGHHVALLVVQRHVGAQLAGDAQPVVVAVDADDGAGAQQPGTGGGAQADRPLGKHHHRVADADVGVFGTLEAGRHDVGAHQHLLIAQAVGDGRQVGLGVGHQQVLGLGAVDQVAIAPAGGGFVTMAAAAARCHQVTAVLRRCAILRGIGVEVGADRPGNHPLALAVALHRAAQLLDHADRLVAHRQALGHRVLALQNVHIGAADRGGGDAQQRVVGADSGDGLVGQFNAAGFDKDGGFHAAGHGVLLCKRIDGVSGRFMMSCSRRKSRDAACNDRRRHLTRFCAGSIRALKLQTNWPSRSHLVATHLSPAITGAPPCSVRVAACGRS